MRAYLIVSGTVFALMLLAHGVRLVVDGPQIAAEPVFVLTTLLAAGLSVWAWRLVRSLQRPPP
jgi:hypothetical protein